MVPFARLRDAGPVRGHHRRACVDARECRPVRRQPHGPAADPRPRRRPALETLLPADLQTLADMKLKYSLLLEDNGGIIDDLMATRRGEDFYVVVNGATKHGDIHELELRLPREVVVDHMKEQALLALQGPKAAEVLEALVPGVSELSFMEGRASMPSAIRCGSAARAIPARTGSKFRCRAAPPKGWPKCSTLDELVRPIGLGARDSLRLEAGPAALRPRPRPRDDAGDGRAQLRDQQAPPRRGRLRRRDADPRRARERAGAKARRVRHRRPPAGARGRAGARPRRQ